MVQNVLYFTEIHMNEYDRESLDCFAVQQGQIIHVVSVWLSLKRFKKNIQLFISFGDNIKIPSEVVDLC